MFFVNTSDVRNFLSTKRKSLATAVSNLLVDKARKISDKIYYEYNQMSRKIQQRTNSIEVIFQCMFGTNENLGINPTKGIYY